MKLSSGIALAATFTTGLAANSTYYNPMLPGWHSDPSCVTVNETYYCATSTFLAVPGLPIYASKDLINWKLASHVWTRPDQLGLPNAARDVDYLQGGFYAPNLRYHDGRFWMTCVYVSPLTYNGLPGTIFTTEDIYDDAAWSDALVWNATAIDPDLFWDTNGTTYLSSAGIVVQTIDTTTGDVSAPVSVWNGTGGPSPEGPHLYHRDGWYYMIIAEGGTELGHAVTAARSRNVYGPYTSDPYNPVLTNHDTSEYFQTVGHVDLFSDANGNLWAMGLATRSGPEWVIYPMGREGVLTPVTWNEGEWPVFSQVRGIMNGWELPPYCRDVPGSGPFLGDPDVENFEPGSDIPRQFLFWRFPADGAFTVSREDHPNTLQIVPSRANLTGVIPGNDKALTGKLGLSFISRRQEDTLFTFSADLSFDPQVSGQEAGISAFLTQLNHIDLGIAKKNASMVSYGSYGNSSGLEFRFRIETSGTVNTTIPSSTIVTPVPAAWDSSSTITMQIYTTNDTHYAFSAWPAGNPNEKMIFGYASALVVSGGSGPFTGTLLGAYATCNGLGQVNSTTCPDGGNAYFSNWRYAGAVQEIANGSYVPATAF